LFDLALPAMLPPQTLATSPHKQMPVLIVLIRGLRPEVFSPFPRVATNRGLAIAATGGL